MAAKTPQHLNLTAIGTDVIEGFGAVSVSSYGATGNGSTDDTAAIQSALDAATGYTKGDYATSAKVVYFPAGSYKITSTLTQLNKLGVRLVGDGQRASVLNWMGTAGQIALDWVNCSRCGMENMGITSATANAPSVMIRCHRNNTTLLSGLVPGWYNFVDLFLGNDSGYGATDGIVFSCESGSDQNNAENYIERVTVQNMYSSGIRFAHSQCKANHLIDCQFRYCDVAAVDTVTGYVGSFGGSFIVDGGMIVYALRSAFYLKGANDAISIRGVNMEECGRLLETSGNGSSPWPITIDSCRYDAGGINADRYVTLMTLGGPLTVRGCKFGDADTDAEMFFRFTGLGSSAVLFEGTFFFWTGSSADAIVSDGTSGSVLKVCRIANSYLDGSGNAATIATEFFS